MAWRFPSHRSRAGRILRAPLRLLPSGVDLPILSGPLRGARWVVESTNVSCWLGAYESRQLRAIQRHVRRGDVVYDLGAHVGYLSLLFSRLTGEEGVVYAFEPDEENCGFVRRHLELNGVRNVRIVQTAVSQEVGTATFLRHSSAKGGLHPDGDQTVSVVSLNAFVASGAPLPDVIKMDIEGAESYALLGARETLRAKHPIIFLSTHGVEMHEWCVRFLQGMSYRVTPLGERGAAHRMEVIATFEGG